MNILLALAIASILQTADVTEDRHTPGAIVRDRDVVPGEDSKSAPGAAPPHDTADHDAVSPRDEYELYRCSPARTDERIDECVRVSGPSEPPPGVSVPEQVREEVKRIGLPRLKVEVQPPGATLVNLETIFHTTAKPFERTVTILDSTVTLRAEAAGFTWQHGDGTRQTTAGPGRPYPAMDVIHRYRTPGAAKVSVDVTYRVTYRIDDGPWHELDTAITATGPATDLRIREARPVLVQ